MIYDKCWENTIVLENARKGREIVCVKAILWTACCCQKQKQKLALTSSAGIVVRKPAKVPRMVESTILKEKQQGIIIH